jgi:beta-N-acetylhexosaminidase
LRKKKPEIPSDFDLRAAIAQMSIVSFPEEEWNPSLETLLKKYRVGGLIFYKENVAGKVSQVKKLTSKIKKTALETGFGLPPFISVDEEGGSVSRLGKLIGEFSSQWEAAAITKKNGLKEHYLNLYSKVSELGFNVNWSPVLDINTNPNNPIIGDRAFSDEARKVVGCGKIALEAARKAGLFTTAKHFPGHGDTSVDSHKILPVLKTSKPRLKERELRPFRMAIREKVDIIMTAHILFQKIDASHPVTFSEKFLKKMLRQELRFKGIIVTDDLNMGAAANHFSLVERIAMPVNAGADILMIRADYRETVDFLETFISLVQNGTIPFERIRESLARISRIKSQGH